MKSPVARTPAALADVLRQALYLAENNPEAALRYLAAVEQTLDVISSNPHIGAFYGSGNPRLQELRVWNVRGFEKYLIFYRASPDAVELIRVLHGSRDIPAILDET